MILYSLFTGIWFVLTIVAWIWSIIVIWGDDELAAVILGILSIAGFSFVSPVAGIIQLSGLLLVQ